MWEVVSSASVIVGDQQLALWSVCVESAYTMGAKALNKYYRKKTT
jgi:hypothetical protein